MLAALADALDGRYPHEWSAEQRAQAMARDMVAPLAQALLSAYAGGNGYNGFDESGPHAQPWALPMPTSGEYPRGEYLTMAQPRKKVRVTRRLMVDGHVIGEHTLENLVPLDTDTEATAAELRARLDAMAQSPNPDDVPTLQQIRPASNEPMGPTLHLR